MCVCIVQYVAVKWFIFFRKQPALSSKAVHSNAKVSKHTREAYCQEHAYLIWQEQSYTWENAHDTGLLVLEKNSIVKDRFVTVAYPGILFEGGGFNKFS